VTEPLGGFDRRRVRPSSAGAVPTPSPALSTTSLWKRYRRGPWALEDVSLSIPAGRIVALVGPNGAGKSTLIRTWLGFEKATRGEVRSAGVDPWRKRGDAIAHLGYIPQQPSLYDELTVEEHVDLAAYLRKGLDRARALERIDELRLPRRSRADELSGGQRAQLGLALVLAAGATILLLDEPLASLDPLARREFLEVLRREAAASGATVLISSHIVRDIEDACEDVIVLVAGRVRLDAEVASARASHRVLPAAALPADAPADAALVGRFPSDAGEQVLARTDGTALLLEARVPSLEELVLGYLASGEHATAGPLVTGADGDPTPARPTVGTTT
jgi:ABC-2 type transport system ATP-binding protein